ncbi:MAG: YihA family ribosome biogenesis GTP-binding protein [Bacteroidales bacterium]|nr:YihA family ribosome biogenesis GTP-binding protein [Bacteroidales bacterium]
MKIKKTAFLQSVTDWRQCPKSQLPEYAFIGRSNVGKSSLINMLVQNSTLAKTSSKPGKTQTINHFIVNDEWYLVDLPGYGFAHTSKETRAKWAAMIDEYLQRRTNLVNLFVLIDSRLEPQNIDVEFINKLGEFGIPFSITFTKADKISGTKLNTNVNQFLDKLTETWEELPPHFITSSVTGKGREEILDFIESINNNNL